MAKSNAATRKARTHFEQVPIEVVKKIPAQDVPEAEKVETTRVSVEPKSGKKG